MSDEYQPRTPGRLIEILRAQDQNPRSWQQEAAGVTERIQAAVIAIHPDTLWGAGCDCDDCLPWSELLEAAGIDPAKALRA